MAISPDDELDSLTREIEQLKEEEERLFSEVNFLLGIAVPQLEHEYLYSISLLELESARTQFEIAKISEKIRWFMAAAEHHTPVDEMKLGEALKALEQEWVPKINKHVHKGNADLLAVTKFTYERDHLKFLLQETLKRMNTALRRSKSEANTDLLRKVSAAYREGNLGELRALRMVIEAKERSAGTVLFRFSFKKFFQSLRFRITKLFSL